MKTEEAGAALAALVDETAALSHRLRAAAEATYGEGEASAGRRGVLSSLARLGPQTVPQLARARPVSRQHIQLLVNALLDDGLVALAANPAHRRSHLVRLTVKGARRAEQVAALDARLLGEVASGLSATGLRAAAQTLRAVRSAFEDEVRRGPASAKRRRKP